MTDFIINESIRARTVRLIENEQVIGVIPLGEALLRARSQSLDLVQIADGDPPVCRILDADRFRFERRKAEREQARRQREMTIDTKEIQLRPVTDDNDLLIKARRARGFLESGDKVKVVVRFRGRERTHLQHGRDMIGRFLDEVGEHRVEKPISNGDRDMSIFLAPVVSKSELKRKQQG